MAIQQLDLGAVFNTLAQQRALAMQERAAQTSERMNALQMARYQREDDQELRKQSALSRLNDPSLDDAGKRSILGEAYPELLAKQAFRDPKDNFISLGDGTGLDLTDPRNPRSVGRDTSLVLDGDVPTQQATQRPTLAPGGRGPIPMPVERRELPAPRTVPAVFQPTIDMHAERTGLDGDFIGRVFMAESGGRQDVVDGKVVSSAGATGPMQTMPNTLKDPGFGVQPARDDSPEEKWRVGTDYLAAMMKKYNGNKALALGAYNWGPGNVDQWMADGADMSKVPAETKKYLRNILGDELDRPPQGQQPQQTAEAPQEPPQQSNDGWSRVRSTKTLGLPDPPSGKIWQGKRRADGGIDTRLVTAPGGENDTRNLTPDEVRQAGLNPGTVAQRDANGKVSIIKEGEKPQTNKDVAEVERGWRNDFKDPIKQSRELTSQLGIIRNSTTKGDGTGDIASIIAFNKLLDPGAVVREADVALTLQAQGVGDRLQTWMANKKEGDILPPELRTKMRDLAEQIHATSNSYLRDGVMTYREAIEHGGGNFDRVLPPQMRKSLGWDDQPDQNAWQSVDLPKDVTPAGRNQQSAQDGKPAPTASIPELPPGFKVIGG
jgi:hypothetical protein